jgi:single-strand DNA-binding protein
MNLNKVMLIGRIGRDPEVRYTKSGQAVANFSMATTDTWKDQQGGKQERTEWHKIVCWGKLADFAQNYLKKGKLIYVEGRMQTRDWTDQQNVKHYTTEVVANTINFMEPRGDSPQQGRPAQAAQGGPGGQGGQPYGPPPGDDYGQNMPDYGGQDNTFVEDDIPF